MDVNFLSGLPFDKSRLEACSWCWEYARCDMIWDSILVEPLVGEVGVEDCVPVATMDENDIFGLFTTGVMDIALSD